MEGKSECETQEEANSLSLAQALTVPVPILASRFRNKREVELVMEASKFAVNFDDVLEKYEMVSVRAQALKEAWDNLWVSQEALLASAIPLIGEKMSEINRIRAHLLKKMDVIIESLQVVAKGLFQYAEINLSVAQVLQLKNLMSCLVLVDLKELRMDGIERLAKDKLFLSELEGELGKRINIICTKGSIHKLSGKMADFINSLITKLELCDVTTQNPGCNSLNKTAKTDQGEHTKFLDMIPTINSSIQCNEKLMGNDSASTSASKAPHLQENNSGQNVITLAHGLALTSPVIGTCFTSQGLAHNDMNMKIQSHSSLVSEEQLSGIGSKFWLLQNKRST
ncbi:uncharacterized protein LOC131079407 isoform X6 [Cryptomeria japonica]|uniref:uncharacterized protein LOC131079407 isoform X6 n=1 Tax=Cryptomeria japonica TaxID=3369 RepID=UPI0025AC1111|nr:uncharacterized protein LOC131079407 isoform X6 [Cryptomeria japonica]